MFSDEKNGLPNFLIFTSTVYKEVQTAYTRCNLKYNITRLGYYNDIVIKHSFIRIII